MTNVKKLEKEKILIIIPAFNESGIIFNVVNELKKNTNYDYVIINDYSYDSTELILKDNNLNFISNQKNLGLSNSMREGMKYAINKGYDACIQYDGDGQHDYKTIPEMIKMFKKGYEIVLTSRFLENDKKNSKYFLKNIAWKIFIFIFKNKSKMNITDPTCGLRLYNKRFMQEYIKNEKFEVEPSTILFAIKNLNFKIIEIPTKIKERITGKSTFTNLFKIIKYMSTQLWRMIVTTKWWKTEN